MGPTDLRLDLGFTDGFGMDFDEAAAWAADAGFEFVELLLDGPYTRQRIVGQRAAM